MAVTSVERGQGLEMGLEIQDWDLERDRSWEYGNNGFGNMERGTRWDGE